MTKRRHIKQSPLRHEYDVEPTYKVRFIAEQDTASLVNLYHLARTALSGKDYTPYDQMLWASAEFAKIHPKGKPGGVTQTGAYKDLCGLLDR